MTYCQNLFFLFSQLYVCFADMEVLVPDEGTSLVEDQKKKKIPKWKLRLPSAPFGLLKSLNQQAKRGITVLGAVNFSKYHRIKTIVAK